MPEITVTTAEEFMAVRTGQHSGINEALANNEGVKVLLGADIDLKGRDVSQSGTVTNVYMFDGQGHTVKNISVQTEDAYLFFGIKGIIRNVTFSDIEIKSEGAVTLLRAASVVPGEIRTAADNVYIYSMSLYSKESAYAIYLDNSFASPTLYSAVRRVFVSGCIRAVRSYCVFPAPARAAGCVFAVRFAGVYRQGVVGEYASASCLGSVGAAAAGDIEAGCTYANIYDGISALDEAESAVCAHCISGSAYAVTDGQVYPAGTPYNVFYQRRGVCLSDSDKTAAIPTEPRQILYSGAEGMSAAGIRNARILARRGFYIEDEETEPEEVTLDVYSGESSASVRTVCTSRGVLTGFGGIGFYASVEAETTKRVTLGYTVTISRIITGIYGEDEPAGVSIYRGSITKDMENSSGGAITAEETVNIDISDAAAEYDIGDVITVELSVSGGYLKKRGGCPILPNAWGFCRGSSGEDIYMSAVRADISQGFVMSEDAVWGLARFLDVPAGSGAAVYPMIYSHPDGYKRGCRLYRKTNGALAEVNIRRSAGGTGG